ncbi:hypothetical protein AT269_13475 [Bacillus cereus]|nr:hypothetical protein AT269_13475 [Bacillus cereus]KXY39100.1 hypothetical protein AT257_24130 [Bacillus cereus]
MTLYIQQLVLQLLNKTFLQHLFYHRTVDQAYDNFGGGELGCGNGERNYFRKNAHPALFVRNNAGWAKLIGSVKIVPKLCMEKVLKEMNSTLYILFHI